MHRSCLKLHPVLDAVFRAFGEASVRYCLLRLPSNIGSPTGGDVDLLIHREDVGSALRVLKTLGFVQLPWRGHLHTHFLSYDLPTDCWIWLDIATELSFGPYYALRTLAEAGCLARRQNQEGVFMLAPPDAFWALLLHCVLDKGAIAPHHRARLQELVGVARMDDPLARVIEVVCPTGWTPMRMMECALRGDWITLEQFAPSLTAAWMRRHSIGAHQLLVQRGLRLMGRLRNLIRCRGLSVALMGPDGAGKSTLAAAIQKAFIFPARSVYMGLYGGYLTRIDKVRVPVLVVLGRLFILWGRYLIAHYHQLHGRLVIFDRYTYDGLLPSRENLSWLKRIYRWVDAHACPAPDLVLILDAPGELMYERKGRRKHSPEELEGIRQDFLVLRRRMPQLQIVDASRAQDAVRADVINRIWRRYVVRWTEN
jgi:thymidylate kinase